MACIIIAIDRRDHLLVFLFARFVFPSDRANRARGRNPTSRASISACAREPRAWARGRRPFTFATFWVLETRRTCGSRQRPQPQAPANRAHGRNPTTKRVGGHARVAKPKRVHVQIAPQIVGRPTEPPARYPDPVAQAPSQGRP